VLQESVEFVESAVAFVESVEFDSYFHISFYVSNRSEPWLEPEPSRAIVEPSKSRWLGSAHEPFDWSSRCELS
jgi:hypothetical protein